MGTALTHAQRKLTPEAEWGMHGVPLKTQLGREANNCSDP